VMVVLAVTPERLKVKVSGPTTNGLNWRGIGIRKRRAGRQEKLTGLTAPDGLQRDGVTYNAKITLAARTQPPGRRPGHVRYSPGATNIRQLTHGARA
jgi:hypothetical protein